MKNKKKYLYLILYLISFLIFYNFPFKEVFKWDFLPAGPEKAEANLVTIDSSITSTVMAIQRTPNVVFLGTPTVPSTGIGYVFGVDSDGTCVYWKTVSSGVTWSTAVAITAQTDCLGTTIWYDRWTPGDTTGNYIHIVFAEQGGNDLYYERLDTTDDSELGETDITSQSATLLVSNSISITKGTDETLYAGTSDTSDSFIVSCSSSCGTAGNWSEVGTNPMDADEDEIILRPLASGNIMLVNWDISGNMVRSKVWNTASWDAGWSNITTSTDTTSYKHGFDVTVNPSNNNLYIAVCSSGTVVRTGTYNGSSWSTSTGLIYNTRIRGSCTMNYDPIKNYYWIAFSGWWGGVGAGAQVYLSTDDMSSWKYLENLGINGGSAASSFNLIGNLPFIIEYDTPAIGLQGKSYDNLIQSSYRFQNDDSAPNNNTNMANATTSISDVKIGQRITTRVQLENYGSAATTSIFSIQFTTGIPTSSDTTWTEVGPWTAISYATGTAANAAAITSQVAGAPTGFTWVNGTWHEATSTTNSFTITNARYTEFAFMIHTANATVNTTYYLRLYNKENNIPLNSYLYYPTLTTVSTANNTKRYSKETIVSLPTTTNDLQYYLDDLGYTYVASDDANRDSIGNVAGQAPMMMFVEKNTNSTDQIDVSWNGQTNTACDATKYAALEAYNFTVSGWQSKATSTTCTANTDFDLTATISSSISSYYSSNWTYWRIYQNADGSVLRTDLISFTFTSAGALSLTAPSSVTFTGYVLSGTGINQYTYATGTEQIVAADSGIGSGWVLSGTATEWTSGSYTIDKSMLKFRSDGITSTEPSLIFSNQSYSGVSEGTDGQNFSSSVTLMQALESYGVGTYYFRPTFDLYISNTSTYAGSYVATMTLTLAYQYQPRPVFKTVWQRLRDFSASGRNAKFFDEGHSFNKLAGLTDYNLPLDFRRLTIKTKVIA